MSIRSRLRSFLFLSVTAYSVMTASPLMSQNVKAASDSLKLREIPIRIVHVKGTHYDVGYQTGGG